MSTPCIDDTNSVDLSVNAVTGHLSAAVRRDGAGAIAESANGIKISLASPSGLEIASNTLRVDVQGGGLVRGTAGLMKITQASGTGSFIGVGNNLVTQTVLHGASADIATAITINLTNSGDTATRFTVHSTWGVDFATTNPALETSNIFDQAYIQLQRNLNGAGYFSCAHDGLLGANQSRRAWLQATEFVLVAASTTVSYAVKPVRIGGTLSGTATQGHVSGHFGGSIAFAW